jgi:hypothetical protein
MIDYDYKLSDLKPAIIPTVIAGAFSVLVTLSAWRIFVYSSL